MSNFVTDDPDEMAKALEEMRRRLEEQERLIRTNKGRVMLKAARVIEARAKEITTEKNHIVSGSLRRSWNSQVIRESATQIITEVGTPLVYGKRVEALPAGPVRPRSTGPRGGKIPGRGAGGGILGPAAEQRFKLASEILVDEGLNPALERWSKGGGAA
jgi:hypothetical protein